MIHHSCGEQLSLHIQKVKKRIFACVFLPDRQFAIFKVVHLISQSGSAKIFASMGHILLMVSFVSAAQPGIFENFTV